MNRPSIGAGFLLITMTLEDGMDAVGEVARILTEEAQPVIEQLQMVEATA